MPQSSIDSAQQEGDDMGLLDAFQAGPPVKRPPCAVCDLREELKKKRKDADLKGLDSLIEAVLLHRKSGQDPKQGWNSYNVVTVLNSEGYNISRRQLDKHLHHDWLSV